MRDVTLWSINNKSDQNCRFVHHAKFHCIMTTFNRLFKIQFGRGELEKSQKFFLHNIWLTSFSMFTSGGENGSLQDVHPTLNEKEESFPL